MRMMNLLRTSPQEAETNRQLRRGAGAAAARSRRFA